MAKTIHSPACKTCEARMAWVSAAVRPLPCEERVALEGRTHWCRIGTGHHEKHTTYCNLEWAKS